MIHTPEDNTFTRQPEFIDTDNRRFRPRTHAGVITSYTVTQEFMFLRHSAMLPPDMIRGKTILDIGSCYGASGAWCLDNGAAHYTGLEPQSTMVNDSKSMLGKYYSGDRFDIVQETLEDFDVSKKYDIVLASGVLYGVFDPYWFIRKVASLASENVVIETAHPYIGGKMIFQSDSDRVRKHKMMNLNLITIVEDVPLMVDADSNGNFVCSGTQVSINALITIFKRNGWGYDSTTFEDAARLIPECYDLDHPDCRRYMAKFFPSDVSVKSFKDVYLDSNAKKIPWINGDSTNK